MTTPYENGYQLGVQHREPFRAGLRRLNEREYDQATYRLTKAYNANESVLAAFREGYLRGRYGMGAARKVGGGSTPW